VAARDDRTAFYPDIEGETVSGGTTSDMVTSQLLATVVAGETAMLGVT
jgi:hypothetical protein